jgi:hypothetical protein
MSLRSMSTARRNRRYGAVENPFHPERIRPTRMLIAASFGAVTTGLAGYVMGMVTPVVSKEQGWMIGGLVGASIGALRSMGKSGVFKDGEE